MRPAPRPTETSLTTPARPQTASKPSTATITGSRKGAPSRPSTSPRPGNARRISARAKGTASATLRAADRVDCSNVNRTAAQSAGPSAAPVPA